VAIRRKLFLISFCCARCVVAQRGGKRDDKDRTKNEHKRPSHRLLPCQAQGPRAISVLQWQADEKGNATLKLLRSPLWTGDKYYDCVAVSGSARCPWRSASVWSMEVFDRGKPFGYFTIEHPMPARPGEDAAKQWFAFGGMGPAEGPVKRNWISASHHCGSRAHAEYDQAWRLRDRERRPHPPRHRQAIRRTAVSATAKTDDKTASKSTKDANKDAGLNRR